MDHGLLNRDDVTARRSWPVVFRWPCSDLHFCVTLHVLKLFRITVVVVVVVVVAVVGVVVVVVVVAVVVGVGVVVEFAAQAVYRMLHIVHNPEQNCTQTSLGSINCYREWQVIIGRAKYWAEGQT